jgi:hypothetical protein
MEETTYMYGCCECRKLLVIRYPSISLNKSQYQRKAIICMKLFQKQSCNAHMFMHQRELFSLLPRAVLPIILSQTAAIKITVIHDYGRGYYIL